VASNIRNGKTHLIDSIIETSKDVGMLTLKDSVNALIQQGVINPEDAKDYIDRNVSTEEEK
jgi:Tfp pilus assembly pilus retraction ATPase PilT